MRRKFVVQPHAVRAHEEIARRLLRTAGDFDATAVVVGREGRPGSVVEHLRALGLVDGDRPDGAASIFLRAKDGATIPKSQAWTAAGVVDE